MDFREYQEAARKTAIYPNVGDNLPYLALGIADEAGEVAGKVKKLIRDQNFASITELSDVQKEEIVKEVGDVLWYAAQIATEMNANFEEVAEKNIEKLYSRLERDTLKGSGDDR